MTNCWRYVAASVAGSSHLERSIPCQDAHAVTILPLGDAEGLVVVVSDGAGSAACSAEGAQFVCERLQQLVGPPLISGDFLPMTEAKLCEVFRSVVDELQAHAAERGTAVREFACTLLAAVVCAGQAGFLQIGDGAIVIAAEGGYRPVFWPQSGEYLNTTYFVTDLSACETVEAKVLHEEIREIAIFTDGLEMLALHYESRSAHAPFFLPMFARMQLEPIPGQNSTLSGLLAAYLGSPLITERTDDDTTLVLASRGAAAVDAGQPESHSV